MEPITLEEVPVKIWCISDLHSELSSLHKALKIIRGFSERVKSYPTCRKILFIPGDFGNPRSETYSQCLQLLASSFDHIVGVAGNHEYYRVVRDKVTIDHIDEYLHHLYQRNNSTFLQCEETYLFNTYKVIGATLWSDIDSQTYASMNDGVYIFKDIQEYQHLHKHHREYLEGAVGDSKSLVITHHLPTFKAIHPCYRCLKCRQESLECSHDFNTGYASNLDHLVAKTSGWFCGHTHESFPTPGVYLNPYGYPGESKTTTWLNTPIWSSNKLIN